LTQSATIPANTYGYIEPQILVDVSLEYRLTRWLSLHGSARNATQSPKLQGRMTPDYAQRRQAQRFGAMYTAGVKGQF